MASADSMCFCDFSILGELFSAWKPLGITFSCDVNVIGSSNEMYDALCHHSVTPYVSSVDALLALERSDQQPPSISCFRQPFATKKTLQRVAKHGICDFAADCCMQLTRIAREIDFPSVTLIIDCSNDNALVAMDEMLRECLEKRIAVRGAVFHSAENEEDAESIPFSAVYVAIDYFKQRMAMLFDDDEAQIHLKSMPISVVERLAMSNVQCVFDLTEMIRERCLSLIVRVADVERCGESDVQIVTLCEGVYSALSVLLTTNERDFEVDLFRKSSGAAAAKLTKIVGPSRDCKEDCIIDGVAFPDLNESDFLIMRNVKLNNEFVEGAIKFFKHNFQPATTGEGEQHIF